MNNNNSITRFRSIRNAVGLAVSMACTAPYAIASDYAMVNEGADISTMCGDKPMKVGLSDGYGGNTWRRIAYAELKDELSKCNNVETIMYTNANGDQQKAKSDINSMVAQGVDLLLLFPDFGAAQLPAMRAATRYDVTVVPYLAQVEGRPGKDFSANVYEDVYQMAVQWADWYGEHLKEGNVIMLGGSPGAASSQRFLEGFKDGLAKYPSITLLEDNYIVTNWNPVDAQKAVSGLIAKYPKIDGIATDYGVTATSVMKAYDQAGRQVPALATNASNNELNCAYLGRKGKSNAFSYFSLDGTTGTIRFAARRAVANFQGTENDEPLAVMPFVYADSANDIDPKCDPKAPVDADLSSALPSSSLQEIFKQ